MNIYLYSQSVDNKINTIVLDAGHGGKDPGTLGTNRYNTYEKHIALDITLRLAKYIEDYFPEIDIVYTRKDDVFLELWERTEIANNSNADLFISIHCDGFSNPEPNGSTVFIMGMSKLKANMDVAIRENSVMYLEDNYKERYNGFDPKSPESYIVFSLMQNVYLDQSISFAQEIDKQFVLSSNRNSRGVKQAPFYVISRVNMPSVLIETGFLTNPEEEDYLNSENGKEEIAFAIFNAFKNYKNVNEGISNDLNIKSYEFYDEIEYKIQISSHYKSIISSKMFYGLDVEEFFVDETYKYFLSAGSNKSMADKLKIKCRSGDFPDAFIVAFYKGEQISVKEALNLQNKYKNEK
tara:strand:+ start:75417 stop:76469 length:1053 start_codon:yes stop_codon:yes gene_type:complete